MLWKIRCDQSFPRISAQGSFRFATAKTRSMTTPAIRTSALQTAGLCAGFAGSMLVLKVISAKGLTISSLSFGDAMVFAGAFCWALYTVLAHRTIKRIGGLLYTSWSVLFAGFWILLFQLAAGFPVHIPARLPDILCTAYLGLIPTALAFFSWNNAQRYISTGLLAVSGYFTPMLTALLGWLFFAQSIRSAEWFSSSAPPSSSRRFPPSSANFSGKSNQ